MARRSCRRTAHRRRESRRGCRARTGEARQRSSSELVSGLRPGRRDARVRGFARRPAVSVAAEDDRRRRRSVRAARARKGACSRHRARINFSYCSNPRPNRLRSVARSTHEDPLSACDGRLPVRRRVERRLCERTASFCRSACHAGRARAPAVQRRRHRLHVRHDSRITRRRSSWPAGRRRTARAPTSPSCANASSSASATKSDRCRTGCAIAACRCPTRRRRG